MGDDGFFAQTGMPFSDEYSPSAPRGILVGIVPQIVKSNPFDGTAAAARGCYGRLLVLAELVACAQLGRTTGDASWQCAVSRQI